MRLFLDVFNVIIIFILTVTLLLSIWFTPGPNAVYKEEVVRHGYAHWETNDDGKAVFVWNK
jgi:hypothetical protein